jgi:alkanesulfonate monooxygenase SsuD/methylene tetrahydromethanopterin reductase-like flavin-dependent oxidoreductase (luciferase family)
LILVEDERAVAAKVRRYFPNGLDAFWSAHLVSGTPDQVAVHFQGFVDAGVEYFVVQTLDPDDEESISMITCQLAPRLEPKLSN